MGLGETRYSLLLLVKQAPQLINIILNQLCEYNFCMYIRVSLHDRYTKQNSEIMSVICISLLVLITCHILGEKKSQIWQKNQYQARKHIWLKTFFDSAWCLNFCVWKKIDFEILNYFLQNILGRILFWNFTFFMLIWKQTKKIQLFFFSFKRVCDIFEVWEKWKNISIPQIWHWLNCISCFSCAHKVLFWRLPCFISYWKSRLLCGLVKSILLVVEEF